MKRKVIAIISVMVIIVSILSMSVSAETVTLSPESSESLVQECMNNFLDENGLGAYKTQAYNFYHSNRSVYPYFILHKGTAGNSPTVQYCFLMSKTPITMKMNYTPNNYYVQLVGNLSYQIQQSSLTMNTKTFFSYAMGDTSTMSWNDFITWYNQCSYLANHNISTVATDPYIPANQLNKVFFSQMETSAPIIQNPQPLTLAMKEVHSLIPYLVVFLIGLVAFWKAWAFLSTQLRKA